MKKLIFIVTMLIVGYLVKAQIPSVVYDPTSWAEAVQTTTGIIQLGKTMEQLKKVQEGIEKVKGSVDWIRKTHSIIKLLEMIESTYCMLDELHVNMTKGSRLGKRKSCINDIEYNIAITKLLLAVDQINSTLKPGEKMTVGERWNIIAIALNNFTDSQIDFSKLNKKVKEENQQIEISTRVNEVEKREKERFIDQMVKYYN